MNKYQEALDYVNKSVCTALVCLDIEDNKTRKYLHTLQELVNKETPMKPKTIKSKVHKGTEWVCPNCNHHIAYFDELGIGTVRVFNYCIECGQRLNLRSDKDEQH